MCGLCGCAVCLCAGGGPRGTFAFAVRGAGPAKKDTESVPTS